MRRTQRDPLNGLLMSGGAVLLDGLLLLLGAVLLPLIGVSLLLMGRAYGGLASVVLMIVDGAAGTSLQDTAGARVVCGLVIAPVALIALYLVALVGMHLGSIIVVGFVGLAIGAALTLLSQVNTDNHDGVLENLRFWDT